MMRHFTLLAAFAVLAATPLLAQQQPAAPAPTEPYDFLMAKFAADEGNYDDALSRLDKLLASEPDNPVLLFERATVLLDASKIDRAETELRKVVKIDPKFYEAQRTLGHLLLDRSHGRKADAEEALEHLRAALERNPGDMSTGMTVAQLLASLNRLEEAAKVLQNLVERAPDQRSLNYAYAQVLTKLGRGNESQPYLERTILIDPTFGPAVFQLLDIYREAGEFTKAAEILQPLIEQDPVNLDLQRQQALFYLRAGEPEKARVHLQQLVTADPSDLRTKFYLAESLNDLQRFKEAEVLYREVLEKTPQDAEVLLSFGMNQMEQRNFDEATKTFNSLLAVPELPPQVSALGRTQLAVIDFQRGDLDSALRRAREILSFGDRPNGQAINLAMEVLKRQNHPADALALIEPLYKQFPNEPLIVARYVESLVRNGDDARARAAADAQMKNGKKAAMTVAEAYVQADHYKEGIAILDTLRKSNPDDADILFELGAFNERSGNVAEAEKIFLALLDKHPDHTATLNYLGYMWADRGVNLDRAAAMLSSAVTKEPDNGAFVDSLGWVYFRQGKLDLAEKYLTDATRLLPGDATVQEHLGDVLAKEGDTGKALDRYKRALTLNPEPKNEQGLKSKIAELEKRSAK